MVNSMRLTSDDLFGESGLTAEKIQKERKEYVKNIGIEYRYGCYEEKRPDSCHLLADYREAVELNLKSAFRLYKENCEERNYAKSCFKYARYILTGKESEPNSSNMIKPLEVACDAKIGPACKLLALVHWNGDDQKKPDSKKAEFYQKIACDLGEGEACWMLSTWYMGPATQFKILASDQKTGHQKGKLERDMENALAFGIRACDNNVYQSCANISRMYKLGDGIPKNLDKANEFKNKAQEIIENIKNGLNPNFTA